MDCLAVECEEYYVYIICVLLTTVYVVMLYLIVIFSYIVVSLLLRRPLGPGAWSMSQTRLYRRLDSIAIPGY